MMGRSEEAAPKCNAALVARHQVLGAAHVDTISSLSNCALCYEYQGQRLDALPLHTQAVEIVRDLQPPSETLLATVLCNYGSILCVMFEGGDQEEVAAVEAASVEATTLYKEAVGVRCKVLGHEDIYTMEPNPNPNPNPKVLGHEDIYTMEACLGVARSFLPKALIRHGGIEDCLRPYIGPNYS